MAAERAPTMASTIQKKDDTVKGFSRWAKVTAAKAKGRAKMVWLNLMSFP
jgi:hypothetical protein